MESQLRVVQDGSFSPDFVSRHAALNEQLRKLWKLARKETPLFFHGESGTGKTLLAADVHQVSPRGAKPFVVVDCTSLPEGVIESELFGHVKGAFTSASSNRTGLIESANGGTVFLDEISDLPLNLQSKLLRVVQHGKLRPVGSSEEVEVDVRWICATHGDLAELIGEGKFRLDLYYRLCMWTLKIPALRDRPEDIRLHAEHFFESRQTRLNQRCTPAAIRLLLEHKWPGNIRELESVLEVTHDLVEQEQIDAEDLQLERRICLANAGESAASNFGETVGIRVGNDLESAQRALVQATLRTLNGNVAAAAVQLKVSTAKLRRMMKGWEL